MSRLWALGGVAYCFLSFGEPCVSHLVKNSNPKNLASHIEDAFKNFKFNSKYNFAITIYPSLSGNQVRLNVRKEESYIGYFNFICKANKEIELEGAFLKEAGSGVGEKILEHLADRVPEGTHLTFLSSNDPTENKIRELLKQVDVSEAISKQGSHVVIDQQKLQDIQSKKVTQLIEALIEKNKLEDIPVWAKILHKSHWKEIKIQFRSDGTHFSALTFLTSL